MTGIEVQRIDLESFVLYGFGVRQGECLSVRDWPEGIVTVETVCMVHSRPHRAFVGVPCTVTLQRMVVSRPDGVRFRLHMGTGWREQLPPRLFPGPVTQAWYPAGALLQGTPASCLERAQGLNAVTEIDGVHRLVGCGTISRISVR